LRSPADASTCGVDRRTLDTNNRQAMLSYRPRIMQSSQNGAGDRSALFDIVDNHLELGD
jgi:hypothetical protein